MIHDLVYRTLLKFKQKPNKELYYNNVKEETDEFFEAETEHERVKEAVDILWVTIGYLWSVFNGNILKVLQAYKTVYNSNISKICYSEEDAIRTVEMYKNKKNKNVTYIKYNDDDGDYWVIYDRNGKYKKGINYVPADMTWINSNNNI